MVFVCGRWRVLIIGFLEGLGWGLLFVERLMIGIIEGDSDKIVTDEASEILCHY